MIPKHSRLGVFSVALVVALASTAAFADPFTYQGQLKQSGAAITGPADFQFTLWNAASAGTQIGVTYAVGNVSVTGGLFSTQLDFGNSSFDGTPRWLQIAVRSPAGGGSYSTLNPRQPLSATPYALYALNGTSLWHQTGSAISNSNTGFVGVNRTNPLSSAEYFGIEAPATGSNYGGMYIHTTSSTGRPFYGYSAGTGGAWTYLDGATGDLRIYNTVDMIDVTNNGKVGINTDSPTSTLHVNGDLKVTNGLVLDGPYNSTNSSVYGYATTSGDMMSMWNDGSGNAAKFQARNGNAIQATTIAGSSGNSVNAVNYGTGNAGGFYINNPSSGSAALYASTNGTGPAGRFDGRVDVFGKLNAKMGTSVQRGTPIAYGCFSPGDALIAASANVAYANVTNATRITVSGESNPASWIVTASLSYTDPVNPDYTLDLRVGIPNASGQILFYTECTSGCGTFTSQDVRVNFEVFQP